MATADGGPYVQVATFCEKIIRGAQSGALSIINILDTAGVAGEDPNEMPAFTVEGVVIVINLWAGETRGRYTLKLRPETPGGIQGDLIELGSINFSGPSADGIDTIVPMPPYEVTEEGVHWFDVIFGSAGQEDRILTRLRLNVTYQPQLAR
jgi:hypothetical protein